MSQQPTREQIAEPIADAVTDWLMKAEATHDLRGKIRLLVADALAAQGHTIDEPQQDAAALEWSPGDRFTIDPDVAQSWPDDDGAFVATGFSVSSPTRVYFRDSKSRTRWAYVSDMRAAPVEQDEPQPNGSFAVGQCCSGCSNPNCPDCGEGIARGDEHYERAAAPVVGDPEPERPAKIRLKVDLKDAPAGEYEPLHWNDRFPAIASNDPDTEYISLPDSLWEPVVAPPDRSDEVTATVICPYCSTKRVTLGSGCRMILGRGSAPCAACSQWVAPPDPPAAAEYEADINDRLHRRIQDANVRWDAANAIANHLDMAGLLAHQSAPVLSDEELGRIAQEAYADAMKDLPMTPWSRRGSLSKSQWIATAAAVRTALTQEADRG